MLDYPRPTFDETDQEIKDRDLQHWHVTSGPRVGDFVEMLDGTKRRFTYHHDDRIQTTMRPSGDFGPERFYFNGRCDYSGALDRAIPIAQLEDTGRIEEGRVWFFHHGQARAHNGVQTTIPCRVYRQIAACA